MVLQNLFYYFLYNKLTGELKPTKDEQIPEGFVQILPLKEDGSHGNWRDALNRMLQLPQEGLR